MKTPGIVTHVRVYIDRATVTRARALPLEAGVQEVDFSGLPLDLETDTLRARASRGGSPVPVLGVASRPALSSPPSGRRAEVEARLDEVEAKLRATRDAQSSDEHAAGLLSRYAELASSHLSANWLDAQPAFEDWSEALDQLRDSHGRLAGTRAAREAEVEDLVRTKKELERELLRLGERTTVGHDATVTIDAPEGEGEVQVELSYVTRAAQWMPAYDARVEGDGEAPTVAWSAVALVKQTTGEDWADVDLVATTARPPLAEPPPRLAKVTVSGHARAPDREVVARHDAGPRLSGGGGAAQAPAAQVEHAAPGKVSVPSTARPVRVELFEATLPARRRLEVAPMTRPVATWVLDLENSSGRVLLPGVVNLFRGANYSGRTEVGFVSGQERFRLPLATEGGLRIERATHPQPVRKAAVTGTQTHEYETRVTVENVGAGEARLWVLDRVPVSRSQKVSVSAERLPAEVEVDAETGRLTWPVTVAAGAKATLSVRFSISAPRGMTVRPPETF